MTKKFIQTRYRLYRNLHKGCFSVQKYIPKKGYRVIDHVTDNTILYGCTFKVYQSGREKVLREKQKNVHAYVEFTSYANGEIVHSDTQPYYNPYSVRTFVDSHQHKPLDKTYTIQIKNNQLFLAQ